MNLSYRVEEGIGVVRVHAPRIDAAVAIQFKDRFSAVTGEPGAAIADTVLLDLEEVEFLDSSGLGAVVAARKLLGTGRTLALAALQPAVAKVMRLTHMDRIFPIYPDAAAALAGAGGRGGG
ncbi:STAS domain-containing protein [Roseibacterium sp. SDUM158016]|uniref:STAS domain-containing protein n=1 Tax=Roseicyclus sediminis TaxID=2980997 RepID=UPI0021D26447|nr:STAS domain-containing protein [Roseibacterium sp. SDUM158016]MCU4652466.1 STAS domain-containing protein [Roseibacterium sp. SDUM158016]